MIRGWMSVMVADQSRSVGQPVRNSEQCWRRMVLLSGSTGRDSATSVVNVSEALSAAFGLVMARTSWRGGGMAVGDDGGANRPQIPER